MIKVEKTGNDVAISEVIGSTYDLIYEFHVALLEPAGQTEHMHHM